jgi:hypothetical protein
VEHNGEAVPVPVPVTTWENGEAVPMATDDAGAV